MACELDYGEQFCVGDENSMWKHTLVNVQMKVIFKWLEWLLQNWQLKLQRGQDGQATRVEVQ